MAPILIIIPAYNERGRIGPVLDAIARAPVDADVVVIDDASSDDTAAEARQRGAKVLRHGINLGYGSALLTGYIYAKQRAYQRVVQLDADGQHDPRDIAVLLRGLDSGADLVVGSRYLGGDPPPTSLARRLGASLFARIVTWWTRTTITDPTSGFQAMNAAAVGELAHHGFPEDYPDADVLIIVARAGLRLGEAPVQMRERSGGVSMHRGGRAAYYAYKMVLTLCLLPVRRRSPYRAERRATVARSPA